MVCGLSLGSVDEGLSSKILGLPIRVSELSMLEFLLGLRYFDVMDFRNPGVWDCELEGPELKSKGGAGQRVQPLLFQLLRPRH